MLFRVLGPLEVYTPDGRPVEIAADNQRRLLAVLLRQANTWVDAETVVAALWPANPPASAKGNVRTYVHHLRQVLPRAVDGSPRINSRAGVYRINVQRDELDAAVFEELIRQGRAELEAGDPEAAVGRLTRALELWRGEPYGPLGAELATEESARLRAVRDEALDAYQDARRAQVIRPPVEPVVDAEQTVVLRLDLPPGARPAGPEQGWRAEQARAPRRLRVTHVLALLAVLAVLAAGALVGVNALTSREERLLGVAGPAAGAASRTSTSAPAAPGAPPSGVPASLVAPRRPVPALPAPAAGPPRLLFGIGDRADTARRAELVGAAPARMLSTRYRGPGDLNRLLSWRDDVVERAYADGYALHLIVAGSGEPGTLDTRYGPSCGRRDPLTDEFLDQMRKLAAAFAGDAASPPLFVTVFEDVQAFACNAAGFRADAPTTAYYRALKDRFVLVREIFHRAAPNALVSIGWGGRQASGDDPAAGGGASMFKHFASVLNWSDFQSFSAVHNDGNAEDVRAMVGALGQYGPVMLSSYGPAGSARTFDADVRALLTDERLAELTKAGLFAWSFQPDALAASSPDTAAFVTEAVRRYARPAR